MSPKELVWIKYAIKSSSLLPRPVIHRQLTDLFNLSLKSLEFPDDWKLAKVFSTFKVGESKNPNNHRPISVLLTISRVYEKLVYEQVYHYLVINIILDPRPYGFRSL